MNRSLRVWVWVSSITCSMILVPASAALTVIADTGRTESIAPYLEPFNSEDGTPPPPASNEPSVGAADPGSWLPIRSPGLAPGTVKKRSHKQPFARPFFLVGSDPRSWRWLSKNNARLKEIGAVGMLVQAETVGDIEAIIELADGLSILPASASDIAKVLSLSHYPVLISANAIEQ